MVLPLNCLQFLFLLLPFPLVPVPLLPLLLPALFPLLALHPLPAGIIALLLSFSVLDMFLDLAGVVLKDCVSGVFK